LFVEATDAQTSGKQEGNDAVTLSIHRRRPAPQDRRAAVVAADILQIITRALADWLDREPADLAGVRALVEARVRAELEDGNPDDTP
jgi:hypothetical protein